MDSYTLDIGQSIQPQHKQNFDKTVLREMTLLQYHNHTQHFITNATPEGSGKNIPFVNVSMVTTPCHTITFNPPLTSVCLIS